MAIVKFSTIKIVEDRFKYLAEELTKEIISLYKGKKIPPLEKQLN